MALSTFPAKGIFLGGGVSRNERLRSLFGEAFPKMPLFWPPQELCVDNAAMIAGLGYTKFLKNRVGDPLDLEVHPRIPI